MTVSFQYIIHINADLKNKNLESILPLKWINDAENSTFKNHRNKLFLIYSRDRQRRSWSADVLQNSAPT